MIQLNNIVKTLPSNDTINEWIDDIGYIGYIPYDFIRDLYALWSNLIFNIDIKSVIKIESEYDKAFLELVRYIKSFVDLNLTGKDFVSQVILTIKNKVSFREIELARIRKVKFVLEESSNNEFEINDLPNIIIDTLLMNPNKSTTLLTKETLRVLNLLNKIEGLPGNLYSSYNFTRAQIKHYSQAAKIIKHHLISPLFEVNFAKKTLPIKYSKIVRNKKAQVIILFDCSTSIIDNEFFEEVRKAVLLHYINRFSPSLKITIYYYAHYLVKLFTISDVKQLQHLYWTLPNPEIQMKGSKPVIEQIETLFKDSNIVFINDGEDMFVQQNIFNNKWHIITTKYNKYLKQIADNSAGTYINL